MQLYLVEKNNHRYVGECPTPPADTNPGGIELQNSFELVRMTVPTKEGPAISFALIPVGVEGTHSWIVCCPDGFREVADGDPIGGMYSRTRAAESNIELATTVPPPNPRGPRSPIALAKS